MMNDSTVLKEGKEQVIIQHTGTYKRTYGAGEGHALSRGGGKQARFVGGAGRQDALERGWICG